jgi:hypothetical protein
LPPVPRPPIDPERRAHLLRRLDYFLVGAVLLLAGLAVSAPARNSDLWMHLATGRLLAQGQYHFGVDPFAYTTVGVYWANHSWLYDLISYGLYETLGGTSLVIVKALLMVFLAGVLLHLGRGRGSLWIAALCTALAVLAISWRQLLQPTCVSYLFLALTLWILEKTRDNPERKLSSALWTLLGLFVLWVNLDSWFLLGPLVVALYWLDEKHTSIPIGYVVAGFAVCLLNPHHIHAFILPATLGLSAAGAVLRQDPSFAGLFLSPFQAEYFHTSVGLNPAGLAYFSLVLLGLVSFALNYPARPWGRALVWLGLFGLSLYQARNIPFFAVAAGPLMALNFQEFAARRAESRRQSALPFAFYLLPFVFCLGLVVAAWPGWLGAPPYEPRSWTVPHDASLSLAAKHLAQWRSDNRLQPDEVGFPYSAESASALAWDCPEEKTFFDPRVALFSEAVAANYRTIRQALRGKPDGDWRPILRDRHIRYVILHDNDLTRILTPARHLLADPEEWPLLYLDGHTLIFGWQDPASGVDRFAGLRLKWDELLFQQAPILRPSRDPEPRDWWEALAVPYPSRSLGTDTAVLHLSHFDARQPGQVRRHETAWEAGQAAALLGLASFDKGTPAASLAWSHQLSLVDAASLAPRPSPHAPLKGSFLVRCDDGPPELLMLAIRAARGVLQDDPNDASAYLALGEAYLKLIRNTRERAWSGQLPLLAQLRSVQAAAALNQALAARSDLAQAHGDLAALYQQLGYQDLALKHFKEYLAFLTRDGRTPGETAEQFASRLGQLERYTDELDREVKRLLGVYEVRAYKLKTLDQAHLARSLGLTAKALEILGKSNIGDYGVEGEQLELELKLSVGDLNYVREWAVYPELENALGTNNYHWLKARLAAAGGAYAEADVELQSMVIPSVTIDRGGPKMSLRAAVALMASQAILEARSPDISPLSVIRTQERQRELLSQVYALTVLLRREADLHVLRGLLDLESGRPEQAQANFRAALAVWGSKEAAASGAGLDFPGRGIAERFLPLSVARRP